METVKDYFLGLPNSCKWWLCHEIKRRLLLGRKVMTNLDSILKSRDITLPTKVYLVKAMVFPVVVWVWELNYKAEHWRIDAFELWCCGRLLWIPWTTRRSNQSILKEISPECSLEVCWCRNFNTLATWFEKPWCWERLKVGEEVDDRGWDGWMASLTQWTWVRVNSGGWWWTGRLGILRSMGSQRVERDWTTELNCSLYLTENAQAYFWSIIIINNVCVYGTVVFKFFVFYSFSLWFILIFSPVYRKENWNPVWLSDYFSHMAMGKLGFQCWYLTSRICSDNHCHV